MSDLEASHLSASASVGRLRKSALALLNVRIVRSIGSMRCELQYVKKDETISRYTSAIDLPFSDQEIESVLPIPVRAISPFSMNATHPATPYDDKASSGAWILTTLDS